MQAFSSALLVVLIPFLAGAAPWPDRSLNEKIIAQGVPAEALANLEGFLEAYNGHDFTQQVYFCEGRDANDVRPCDDEKRHPQLRVVTLKQQDYSVIVDFSKPSRSKRFFVIDWRTGDVESELATHGSGSGSGDMATRFSNVKDSNATSLGYYLTGEVYHGYHGLTLRLYGLSSTNSQAYNRDIVVHGAWYVSTDFPTMINHKTKQAYGRIGLSWGCPALNPAVASKLIPKITGGAVLYHYVPVGYPPPATTTVPGTPTPASPSSSVPEKPSDAKKTDGSADKPSGTVSPAPKAAKP